MSHLLKCIVLIVTLIPALGYADSSKSAVEDTLSIRLRDGCLIRGSLVVPSGADRKIVIIVVMPPAINDRDNSEGVHSENSTRFLAERLAGSGYSTFRFDNRGRGKSTGSGTDATLLTQAEDVENIAAYLRNTARLKNYKIGLIGHSEGGMAAIAAAAKIPDLSSLLLLATPGATGFEPFDYQFKMRLIGLGKSYNEEETFAGIYSDQIKIFKEYYDILESSDDRDTLKKRMKVKLVADSLAGLTYLKGIGYNKFVYSWLTSQQITIRTYDLGTDLTKVKCPVLAVTGLKDSTVDCLPNLTLIKETLEKGGNSEVTTYAVPNVNHDLRTFEEEPVWRFTDKSEKIAEPIVQKIITWLDHL